MLRVVTALPGSTLEDELVRRLARPDAGATVVRRCLDAVELRSVAGAQLADVAVVNLGLRGIDRDVVTELHAQGLRVIGTSPSPQTSVGFGMDAVVAEDVEQVVSALRHGKLNATTAAQPTASTGNVVAVWGAVGAPGRTVVAITLADELARLGVSTLLADADTYGPSVAQHLGLLDDASGLAAACRLAGHDRLDAAGLRGSAVALPTQLQVLTGLPRPDRWEELLPGALDSVWATCRQHQSMTVVDIGFCLEHDDLAWFEPGTAARNQAAVATLGSADMVLAVCGADPVGLVRFLRAFPTLRSMAPTARIEVVANRVRSGGATEAELRELLLRHTDQPDLFSVPSDRAAFESAMRSGRTLAEAAPRSAARKAIITIAERLSGVSSRRRRRRAA